MGDHSDEGGVLKIFFSFDFVRLYIAQKTIKKFSLLKNNFIQNKAIKNVKLCMVIR